MIRNYIWGAKIGQTTRAKISWDVVIQPTLHGGVKILDPTLQTAALLTKIVVRGLKPGYKPWKTFIRREVQLTKMIDHNRCAPFPHWIMNASQTRVSASPLWKSVFQAFTETRQGLDKIRSTHPTDIIRQPLLTILFFVIKKGTCAV